MAWQAGGHCAKISAIQKSSVIQCESLAARAPQTFNLGHDGRQDGHPIRRRPPNARAATLRSSGLQADGNGVGRLRASREHARTCCDATRRGSTSPSGNGAPMKAVAPSCSVPPCRAWQPMMGHTRRLVSHEHPRRKWELGRKFNRKTKTSKHLQRHRPLPLACSLRASKSCSS